LETPAKGSRALPAVALAVGLAALAVYVRTLLPGVAFGDWAEMQQVPYQLGIAHPTGYPLAILVGKLWSLLPIATVAYRANLLSAVEASAALGVFVLVVGRLGVRPLLAGPTVLLIGTISTVWTAATTARVDALHLLFVALLLHRALVWSQDRRPRDFVLLGLLSGLAVSNHLLAIMVAPLIALFALWVGRRELLARPLVIVGGVVAGLIGLLPYLYIPIRASFGPDWAYGDLLTPSGFLGLVSGAMFYGSMGFLSPAGISKFLAQVLPLADLATIRCGPLAILLAGFGGGALLLRHRSVAVLVFALMLLNMYVYVNYYGNLDHYLILTWALTGLLAAVGLEEVVSLAEAWIRPATGWGERLPSWAGSRFATGVVAIAALAVVATFAGGWQRNDRSWDQRGAEFADQVFAALPKDAVLYSYWDSLEPLWYAHCIEGLRPDIVILAYPHQTTQGCQDIHVLAPEAAQTRPVFGLFMFDNDAKAAAQGMTLTQVAKVTVAYGRPYPEHPRWIYQYTPAP
jgi:hypothetical protein